ncbi:cellulase family glycosylhydrolase [Glycomyces sp. TRM65418]|uniref:cellulase family glycosylhydrolase n=1 Tax=Glycomyces sp. TRM65418 TaxID=2867006 RepID=UPI001CE5728B|nr:cellulase family glycosylhydrolase [Glycomyces sp. TRM65418]MCC3764933.1 cellulase family glycosylhydrolase [Glycomyces sp. TRM65418]QZD54573.1 cellulase family glycosylhydrolase [Glycomyces sp. TRM65418]
MDIGTTDAAPAWRRLARQGLSKHRRMRKWLLAAAATLAIAVAGLLQLAPAGAQQQGGFSIEGTQLIDANGNPFVMRGSTHPDVWYQGEFESFGELSDLGANTVRVVLGSGHRDWGVSSPARVQQIVDECKAQRLICVLEVHDTTGYGEQAGAATLDQAVTFWEGLYSVLEGEEAYVLINIGNEPIGNQDPQQWTQATVNAVDRMRDIGFEHTLVVDAPNWGQDWTNTMRDNAPTVAAADPLGNTLFSVHMYQVYGNAQTVIDYFDAFEAMNLPLIVGEYGDVHQGEPVAWQTVQSEAQARGIGWIAWSYSGNGGGAENLDQVLNFDPNQMTDYGRKIFESQYGIQNTAERASVYGGDPDPTTTPPIEEPPTGGPIEGDCEAAIGVVGNWDSGWQGKVVITASEGAVDGWRLTWTWAGSTRITSSWNAAVTASGANVTAEDVGWNAVIAGGESREVFGFIASSPTGTPAVTCEAI